MEALPSYEQLATMSNADLTNLFGVRDFFVYEVDFSAVNYTGTSQTVQGSFTVQADSNFLWQYATHMSDLAQAAQTSGALVEPLVSATITDSSSGRNLMSAAVPVPSIFGNGQLPFILPTPRFFRAQTTVTISLTNYSAANNYQIKLQFIGTKFYKFAQQI